MAEAIVSATVEKVHDLLLDEVKFICGIRKQIADIQEELKKMKCFPRDADKKQYQEERVCDWIKRIRSLACKIEDVLETCAIKERRSRNILKRFPAKLRKYIVMYKAAKQIVDAKGEIVELSSSLQTYCIKLENEGQSSNALDDSENWQRKNFPHEIEEYFVGMKDRITKVATLLSDEEKNHRVISIYGMGGIGKTTLARKIYYHSDSQHSFEGFAWVSITQQCKPEKICKDILVQLKKGENVSQMGERELVGALYELFKEKKFLVVLDDIWSVNDWNALKYAFPIAEGQIKPLLTTRKHDVAQMGYPYELSLLTDEEGWELLDKKAFAKINVTNPTIRAKKEEIGRQIVHKCGNLPLAIAVIGGLLSRKDSITEWEMVNKDIGSYLKFGEGLEENRGVKDILTLSYDELPYQLKPCFLVLSQFGLDLDIDVRRLYLLWIAEGMVLSLDQRGDETLMDAAEQYLTELASSCLVQLTLNDFSVRKMKYESCRLHDLLQDLCLEKCKEEDFLKVMDFQGGQSINNTDSSGENNAYRLAIHTKVNVPNLSTKIAQETHDKAV